jgi:hypothetical protein
LKAYLKQLLRASLLRLLGVAVALSASQATLATPINVVNASFENDGTSSAFPLGWDFPDYNTQSGREAAPTNPGYDPANLDGTHIAYVVTDGLAIQQGLGANLAANMQYTLEVEVGSQFDVSSGVHYEIRLAALNNATKVVLATESGLTWSPSESFTFKTATLTYTTDSAPALEGHTLYIQLARSGSSGENPDEDGRPDFDNVRLNATPVPIPEPSALGLLGLGAVVLASRLRRRSS